MSQFSALLSSAAHGATGSRPRFIARRWSTDSRSGEKSQGSLLPPPVIHAHTPTPHYCTPHTEDQHTTLNSIWATRSGFFLGPIPGQLALSPTRCGSASG
jgi:hypothetical protein